MELELPNRRITYTSGHSAGSSPTFRASVTGDWEEHDELYVDAVPVETTQEEYVEVLLQSRAMELPARFFVPEGYGGRVNLALVVKRGADHPANQIVETELELMVKDGEENELASATVELKG